LQYYAIIFLNQLLFGPEDAALAQRLISLYFALFQQHVNKVHTEQVAREEASKVKRKELLTKLRVLQSNSEKSGGDQGQGKGKGKSAESAPRYDRERVNIMAALNAQKRSSRDVRQDVEMVHSKLMSALLTGVNRAYPYAHFDDARLDEQMDTLFRIIHTTNFNLAIQALQLVFHVMQSRAALADRFYRALYEKLLSAELRSTSKHALFLNLVYKSLKYDTVASRVAAVIKRVLQVCLHASITFTCGACILVSEILKTHPSVRNLITAPAKISNATGRASARGTPQDTNLEDTSPRVVRDVVVSHPFDVWSLRCVWFFKWFGYLCECACCIASYIDCVNRIIVFRNSDGRRFELRWS
jgi:hypothetical protein